MANSENDNAFDENKDLGSGNETDSKNEEIPNKLTPGKNLDYFFAY